MEGLIGGFEEALKALPSCDDCARVALLDQIRKTGGDGRTGTGRAWGQRAGSLPMPHGAVHVSRVTENRRMG